MTTATVRLGTGQGIALDPVRKTEHTRQGVLLTLEGKGPTEAFNCAFIPIDKIAEVIANLELVADVVRGAA